MLILNRDFKMPDDGWCQLAPLGEFPHEAAGVVQVIDAEACEAMASRFAADAAKENFAGVLIDFDHFSLDVGQRSEAAGWIVALEARLSGQSGDSGQWAVGSGQAGPGRDGLWARIRWSDVGQAAVEGGRYRFLSPVWAKADCVDLGPSTDSAGSPQAGSGQVARRVRPVRLLNAAVTNDPNLKGILPLSNRTADHGSQTIDHRQQTIDHGHENRQPPSAEGQGVIGKDTTVDGRGVDFSPSGNGSVQKSESGEKSMKMVIEKLVNHLGLAADASETAVLAAMKDLPTVSAHAQLQNSQRELQGKHDALVADVGRLEADLVNRHLAEFEGVITESAKAFWSEQLLANRESALSVLGELRTRSQEPEARSQQVESPTGGATSSPGSGQGKKPLHNRAAARPSLRQGYAGQAGAAEVSDGKAVRMRNRAHEIVRAEGVPFSVAFRRAEKEVAG
jgi:hypothetical protein